MEPDAVLFEKALLSMDRISAKKLILNESEGECPLKRIENIILPVMESIGKGWETGGIALSQVYMSGRICEELINEIFPLYTSEIKAQPKMAIAVLEDQHLLGKRIVYSVLRASGYVVSDYGHVDAEKLISLCIRDELEILLISTLMLPSALRVGKVSEALRKTKIGARIIVGGAPYRFDTELWREVGADAVCRNASEVIETIAKVMVA